MIRRIFINRWIHMAILLLLLAGAVVLRMQDYPWTRSLQFFAFDSYNRLVPRPPTNDAVVVDIDEASLNRDDLGQWPWSRLVLARMVDNLKAMGAKAIVFDMVFAEADRTSPQSFLQRLPQDEQNKNFRNYLTSLPDNDTAFADSIRRAGNVVTAFVWSDDKNATRHPPVLSQPLLLARQAQNLSRTVPGMMAVATSLPVLAEAAAGNGSFGVKPEIDGVIRKVPLLFSFRDEAGKTTLYPSLALEALRVAQGPKTVVKIRPLKRDEAGAFDFPYRLNVGKYDVPLNEDGEFSIYFSPARTKSYIPAWTVINNAADASRIKDKIVFIGTSAIGLKDLRTTPLDFLITGTESHINVVEQIMSGQYLRRPQQMQGVELLIVTIAGTMIIMMAPFIGGIFLAGFTTLLIALIGAASWFGFSKFGLLFDPVFPGLCLTVLSGIAGMLTYIRVEAERKQVRGAFGLYISPDFMKELTSHPEKLRLGGETRELTVMFTDIRGFTGIAENMSPAELIQLMNDFLTPMSDLVMNNRGTIDKYMGDAMMAFWNAPLDDADHARHACVAALKMNEALMPINESLRVRAEKMGCKPLLLKAGIGLNSGPASVGNMGSKQRFAYSAIGDTVNLASRLESQTKTYNASILISQETQKRIPDFATLEMDLIQVKGKAEPVRVYGLLGDESYAAVDNFHAWQDMHIQFMKAYQTGDFAQAENLLLICQEMAQHRLQNFYQLYQVRLKNLIAHPPDTAWNGVFVATSK